MDFLPNGWGRNDLWLLYMQRTSTDTKAVAMLILLMAFRIMVLERFMWSGNRQAQGLGYMLDFSSFFLWRVAVVLRLLVADWRLQDKIVYMVVVFFFCHQFFFKKTVLFWTATLWNSMKLKNRGLMYFRKYRRGVWIVLGLYLGFTWITYPWPGL